MRPRRILALAAVAAALCVALLALAHAGPRHLPAVPVGGAAESPHTGQPGQPFQPGRLAEPGQDSRPGQPPRLGQVAQAGQPPRLGQVAQAGQPPWLGQVAQAGQPSQPGQPPRPGQPGQQSQPGQPAQPSQPRQPTQPPTTPDPARTWTWPLAPPPGAGRPVIVRPFEPPAKRWQAGHRGVDLLGGPGQEVLAAGDGTVSYAGMLFGRPVVAIDHTAPGRDTLRTTYEPVDPVVKVGDVVRAGQVIGHLVDSPSNHCAPQTCLHWGLVRGFGHAARYLDPSRLLERGPVRLLPVWGMR